MVRKTILFVLLAVCITSMSADTLYSDLGSGYDPSAGLTVSGPTSAAQVLNVPAMPFTIPAATVDGVDLALSWASGTNAAVVSLNSSTGSLPGSEIASWALGGLPTLGTQNPLEHLPALLSLDSGTYWIVVHPGASDTLDAWNFNTAGISGPVAFEASDGSGFVPGNQVLGAFDVTGTVGEPGAIPFLSIGLVLLTAVLVKKKRGLALQQ